MCTCLFFEIKKCITPILDSQIHTLSSKITNVKSLIKEMYAGIDLTHLSGSISTSFNACVNNLDEDLPCFYFLKEPFFEILGIV